MIKKRSEFDLGSAFFGISEVGFLPYGVQMKGVIEKGWNFDKKCFEKMGIWSRECARTIENHRRMRMVLSRLNSPRAY